MWTLVWISWIAFLVIADLIADRKPGATLSEHIQRWFMSTIAKIILAIFFIALYLHFAFSVSVWPVVGGGVGVVYFIYYGAKKEGINLAWTKWLQGVLISGAMTIATGGGAAYLQDGLTKGEAYLLLCMFVGGCLLYMKTHPPAGWDGVERRQDQLPPPVQK